MCSALQIRKDVRFLITGGTGLVGRALASVLAEKGFTDVVALGSDDCDLRDGDKVEKVFAEIRPDYIFHLAARVSGIGGNQRYKSDMLVDNVRINTNVIESARKSGVRKIVAMGSVCVYPELRGNRRMSEDQIWSGPPHPSEDSYGHAKRLMLAQLQAAKEQYGLASAFAVSANLYGPHDNFDVDNGHVIPSLVANFFKAAQTEQPVKVWGSGAAVRDFTYCEDAGRALYEILLKIEGPVNLGSGFSHPIRDVVNALVGICGNSVRVEWDHSKPDGELFRSYNLDRLAATGFKAQIDLGEGLRRTYEWYSANWKTARHHSRLNPQL